MVFSELFNPDWKAYIVENDGQKQISESKHHLVNGYANAWFVDKKDSYIYDINNFLTN